MRGRSVKVSTLEKLLNASYEKDRPKEIDGFQLDEELSVPTVAVYFSPSTRKAKVIIRGTEGTIKDWLNNIQYAVGNYTKTDRFKIAKEVSDKAEAKYGKENIDTIGHSQGSIGARLLGADTANVIELNPAYINEKHLANQQTIRSSRDPVSMLKMFSKAGNDIIIPAKSFNPLTEHSIDILKRLPQEQVIGRGLHVKYRMRIKRIVA
jgi:hypothetical protein